MILQNTICQMKYFIFRSLPCLHERLVITSVVLQLLLVDVDDIGTNAVEKILRVRDYNKNSLIGL